MSEEEDMYNDETMDKVEEILLEQNPDRTTPFTEKERMSVLCTKTIDYFEVRVPKYRSPAVSLINILFHYSWPYLTSLFYSLKEIVLVLYGEFFLFKW